MESPNHTGQTVSRWLLWLMLCVLLWAMYAQSTSYVVQVLNNQAKGSIGVLLVTNPAMYVSYSPTAHRGNITVLKNRKPEKDFKENARKLLESENISPENVLIFEPKNKERNIFTDLFATTLENWRYNPTLLWRPFWAYVSALLEHRTNISPIDYWYILQEFTNLETSDFTIKEAPAFKKGKKRSNSKSTPPATPAPVKAKPISSADTDNNPIVVEILNASGKRGVAQELTQYLRRKNENGILRVDVLQYDNYPTVQEKSWIEDYSGRVILEKQIGKTIGINTEIKVGSAPNVIVQARIIVGKDFKMPK